MTTETFPPPIFVFAAPGLPGPTVAAALGQNPVAYGLPEINLPLMDTVDALTRELIGVRGPQMHGLLRALSQVMVGEQTAPAVEMARRWLDRRGYLQTEIVFRELAQRIAPRRIVAPVSAAILDKPGLRRLLATFPEARIVLLRAHPQAYGALALADTGGRIALQVTGAIDEGFEPPLPDPQILWLQVETALEERLAELPPRQLFTLDTEAVIATPEESLRALARKLGLKYNKDAVAAMIRPEASLFAGPGPMGAHVNGQVFSFDELAGRLPEPVENGLDAPMPWHPEGTGFQTAVREMARAQGYS